jgi:hypothetical protein
VTVDATPKFSLPAISQVSSKQEKSGVAGFCSVRFEMSAPLGSVSGRAGRSLCYSHIHHFKTTFNLLTLTTEHCI